MAGFVVEILNQSKSCAVTLFLFHEFVVINVAAQNVNYCNKDKLQYVNFYNIFVLTR